MLGSESMALARVGGGSAGPVSVPYSTLCPGKGMGWEGLVGESGVLGQWLEVG